MSKTREKETNENKKLLEDLRGKVELKMQEIKKDVELKEEEQKAKQAQKGTW